MTKKSKQSKKATKRSKRIKDQPESHEESDTATATAPADVRQATPATSEARVIVESQEATLLVSGNEQNIFGAPVTAQFVIEDHALRHSWHHLARIRTALDRRLRSRAVPDR